MFDFGFIVACNFALGVVADTGPVAKALCSMSG